MDVFGLRERVMAAYSRHVKSTLAIKDPGIRELVENFLVTGRLWPESLVQFNPAFECIATDISTKEFFGDLPEHRSMAGLFDFENRKKLFPDVDRRVKFCLLTMSRSPTPARKFAFFFISTNYLCDYRRMSVLVNEATEKNPCGISFLLTFDMSNNSGLFRTRHQLESEVCYGPGRVTQQGPNA